MDKIVTNFERAIFLSWYCSRGDCTFCYMSIQKNLIKDPKKAKRSLGSIFAEAIISKVCGWKIEFLSGGYDSYSIDELVFITKTIYKITGQKQWLNIGTLTEVELKKFMPYIEGFSGAIECVNPDVHDIVCPSKPIKPIIDSYKSCEKLGLKKSMTLIIGLGETIDDFRHLEQFIKENNVDRITFYSLNPHKETSFKKSPSIDYYKEWIKKTRETFPKLNIIAGAWYDKTDYFSEILIAGADNFTKFPALKYFGSNYANEIEDQLRLAGREFSGTLTKLPDVDFSSEVDKLDLDHELKENVKIKLNQYLNKMRKKA